MKEEKNIGMREKIISLATNSFYEQGYKNTLFSQIAKELDVTKGLITYYFGTKAELAQEVNTNFHADIHSEIINKLSSSYRESLKRNSGLITSLSGLCSFNMYMKDEKARRFYVEHMTGNFQISIEKTYLPLFFEQQKRISNGREFPDTEYSKMIIFSERAARSSVILAYLRGELNVSYEEVVEYTLALNYRIEKESEKQIKKLVNQITEIYKEMNVEFLPYFKVKIK